MQSLVQPTLLQNVYIHAKIALVLDREIGQAEKSAIYAFTFHNSSRKVVFALYFARFSL